MYRVVGRGRLADFFVYFKNKVTDTLCYYDILGVCIWSSNVIAYGVTFYVETATLW